MKFNNDLTGSIFKKNENFKKKAQIVEDNNEKTVYSFNLKSGTGTMVFCHVFSGIDLVYNNFHAFDCNELTFGLDDDNMIEINHCNKGRFECKFDNDTFLYLGEGDLSVNFFYSNNIISEFPLGYYEGLEIVLDKSLAQKSLNDFIGFEQFDLEYLSKKLADNDGFLIIRSKEEIDHIISELYDVDKKIQKTYFKLKIVEFLLFLDTVNLDNDLDNKDYCSLKQVKIIKSIKKYLIDNISLNLTLDDLSNNFNISKTYIKEGFKAIYGKPIFTWRKEYRLQLSCDLLKNTDYNISKIANDVGYKNSSKFSSAFKSYFGYTPSDYRNL